MIMLCYITHDMLCYVICYKTHVMLCHIAHDYVMLYNTCYVI